MWHKVSESAGVKISPQILRVWFSNELGEQLVPDRFVDIFEGRAPRSVLAKNYTVRGIQQLKNIYDKITLNILNEPYLKQIETSLTLGNEEKINSQ